MTLLSRDHTCERCQERKVVNVNISLCQTPYRHTSALLAAYLNFVAVESWFSLSKQDSKG